MACAPPRPSSAGWKMKLTVPLKLRVSARYFAAPSSMVVWPSWPQACIRPGFWLAYGRPVASWIGSASISARSPTEASPLPLRSTPTTPGLADAAMHLDPPFRQLARHQVGGAVLLQAQFRMGMDIAANGGQFVLVKAGAIERGLGHEGSWHSSVGDRS